MKNKGRPLPFFAGVMLAGFGIALTTRSGLGTTPISSLPWVLTHVMPLSYGTITFLMNLLFVAGQILVLRRRYDFFQLLQIPSTLLFGLCVDLGMWLSAPLATECYPLELLMLVAGAALLGLGVAFQVASDFLCVPGDALVKTLSCEFGWKLSRVKISFDGALVALAAAVSYASLHELVGIREGTLLSVFLVGWFLGLFAPVVRRVNDRV